ncbi:exendin-3-like [Melanotaenia boesemani]|uniref:exendin-3-like n=1 Tax=Melanotaenia boesemani TaxID=1250792 RepID=UPI001C04D174|nr:exendin-3-like [Melanotaenia boesemani]
MCTREASTSLHWRQVKFPTGELRMKLLMWCMLVLYICSSTKEMVMDKPISSRWQSFQMRKGQNIKRHSDGTFTSDFTNYLDKKKAKDFVEWLTSTKPEGCREELLQLAAEV